MLPDHNGYANFDFDGDAPDLFLACLTYFDNTALLKQAFIFGLEKSVNTPFMPLDEIEQPNYGEVCK